MLKQKVDEKKIGRAKMVVTKKYFDAALLSSGAR